MSTSHDAAEWDATSASGFLGGLAAGTFLFAVGLWAHGSDLWRCMPESWMAWAITGRSFGLYGVLGGAVGALLGGVFFLTLAKTALGRMIPPGRVGVALAAVGSGGVVFAALTARGQLDHLAGLPLGDTERWWRAATDGLWALGFAVILALGLDRWTSRWRSVRWRSVRWRTAILWTLPWWLTLAAGELALRAEAPSPTVATEDVTQPQKVVVVGLDGMTLRVLSPLWRDGELPTFDRLRREGAWGSFMTYGTASSPQVWTTMATGQRVRVHGIDDFVRASSGYRAVPLKSSDWRSPALWHLLGSEGQRVAVINWLMTWPPEPVEGYMVPRLEGPFDITHLRTHPETFRGEVSSLLESRAPNTRWDNEPGARRHHTIDRIFDIGQHLIDRESFDFFTLYDNGADAAQHTHWRHHEPEAFDARLWGDASPDRADVVTDVYRHLDQRMARLMESLDDETLLLVVSDHGQLAAHRPRVRLRLDRLLEVLGYLNLDSAGRPQLAESRAYPLVETLWTPKLRLNLNLVGREAQGVVTPDRADALLDRLEQSLARLRLDGRPLFNRIERSQRADLELTLSSSLQTSTSGELLDRPLDGLSNAQPLRDFVSIDTKISGAHDHQGILFAHGPGVRPGYKGQRTLTTPFHRLLWHLTDKVDAVDGWLPILRFLGILDPASTLDLAPTVLWRLGHPVGRDMPGRPLTELFTGGPGLRWIDTHQGALAPPEEASEPVDEAGEESDEEMLERLRSLGYIN